MIVAFNTRKKIVATSIAFAFFSAVPAFAATLMVGPDQQYKMPSAAVAVAQPGDDIKIAQGTYFDCAIWTTNKLTIEGTGSGAILTDKVCQGKAIFVIHANDVTIRNLTFTRARVPDENGAGIRAEGVNLTIENSKFVNDQDGILAGDIPGSAIIIRNSLFDHNGACIKSCAHGVYVGKMALLQIEHSHFTNTQVAHHIKSRALRTVLLNNRIEDGPTGTASYEVDIPSGGSLIMTGNIIEKGPLNQNHTTAITIGEEGVSQPTDELRLTKNTFTNDGPATAFVRNITATPAVLVGNTLKGNSVTPLIGDGSVN